jgi:putative nucleotidyltransferase with HDIG domain
MDRLAPRMFEVAAWATASPEPEDVLRRTVEGLRSVFEAHSAAAYTYHPADKAIQLRASAGPVPSTRSYVPVRRDGFTLRAVSSLRVMTVRDCAEDPTISASVIGAGIRSFACLPLIAQGTVRTVVYLNFAAPREYPDDLVNILFALAGQVAVALDRAEAYQRLRSTHERMIVSLAEAVDARDHATAGHSRRIRVFARTVGRQLGIDGPALQTLETAALLHDIGKIGVSDAVLLKPGDLNAEERREVEQHSIIGARILAAAGLPQEVIEAVRHNHERYDGKGYPARLAGEQIPLTARILAVVDAFEAMTSDRPYRPGMPWAAAAEEIRRQRGTQFDPTVVDAFLALLDANEDAQRLAGDISEIVSPTLDPTIALHPAEASSRLARSFYAFAWRFIERFERTAGPSIAEELVGSLPVIPVFERSPLMAGAAAASERTVRRRAEDYRRQAAQMIAYVQRVCGDRTCDNLLEETFASLPREIAETCSFLILGTHGAVAQLESPNNMLPDRTTHDWTAPRA